MRTYILIFIAVLFSSFYLSTTQENHPTDKAAQNTQIALESKTLSPIEQLYQEFGFETNQLINYKAFEQALLGFEQINPKVKDIITIIDFTLPSTQKRMFVLDLVNKKVLFHSIVSHGRNSGENYATSFSNRHGSYQSSLGFYLTDQTYMGSNGYSLILDGLEKGINDQARARAVVMHGADYCSENVIKSNGRLGRSYGCPALPREINESVINTIKNGSVLYIYANNKEYMTTSTILQGTNYIAQNSTL